MEAIRPFKLGPLAVWHHPAPGTQRVILCHGTNEHSGRHGNHIRFFADCDVELVRFDFRGHGHSDGDRQWIDSFRDYIDDLSAVAGWAQKELPPKPTFFVGHSLGALVAVHWLAEQPSFAAGLVADGGAFGPSPHVSRWMMRLFLGLAGLAPRLRSPSALNCDHLSTDPSVVRSHREDPRIGKSNPINQGVAIIRAFQSATAAMPKLHMPLLFLHGDADRITGPDFARACLALSPSNDKTLKLYRGGYHELHNDVVKDQYFQDLKDWLQAHA